MSDNDLIEIFNHCINHLADGHTIEECLSLYPAHAAQLRPLLETTLLAKRSQFPLAEMLQDQELVWARIEHALPLEPPAPRRPFTSSRLWQLTSAAALLIIVLGGLLFTYSFIVVPATSTLTPTPSHTTTETPEPTRTTTYTPSRTQTSIPTNTFTPTPSATHTPTVSMTHTPTSSMTQTPTSSITQTPTATITAVPTQQETQVIVQGPIEAIEGSVITIYGIDITVDDETLATLEVGDEVYIEAIYIGATLHAQQIIYPTPTPGAIVTMPILPSPESTPAGETSPAQPTDDHSDDEADDDEPDDEDHSGDDNGDDNSGSGSGG
jgi:hypothetical protein